MRNEVKLCKKILDRIYRIDRIEGPSADVRHESISLAGGEKNPINPVNPV